MEPLEDLFSSPGKSDHEEERDDAESDSDESEGEAMDITTSKAPAWMEGPRQLTSEPQHPELGRRR